MPPKAHLCMMKPLCLFCAHRGRPFCMHSRLRPLPYNIRGEGFDLLHPELMLNTSWLGGLTIWVTCACPPSPPKPCGMFAATHPKTLALCFFLSFNTFQATPKPQTSWSPPPYPLGCVLPIHNHWNGLRIPYRDHIQRANFPPIRVLRSLACHGPKSTAPADPSRISTKLYMAVPPMRLDIVLDSWLL